MTLAYLIYTLRKFLGSLLSLAISVHQIGHLVVGQESELHELSENINHSTIIS